MLQYRIHLSLRFNSNGVSVDLLREGREYCKTNLGILCKVLRRNRPPKHSRKLQVTQNEFPELISALTDSNIIRAIYIYILRLENWGDTVSLFHALQGKPNIHTLVVRSRLSSLLYGKLCETIATLPNLELLTVTSPSPDLELFMSSLQSLTRLRRLNFDMGNYGDETKIAVIADISSRLYRLTLSHEISHAEVTALSDILRVNTTLRSLHLLHLGIPPPIDDRRIMSSVLDVNTTLQHLTLTNGGRHPLGYNYDGLLSDMIHNTTLRSLSLSLGSRTTPGLIKVLQTNTVLESLTIKCTSAAFSRNLIEAVCQSNLITFSIWPVHSPAIINRMNMVLRTLQHNSTLVNLNVDFGVHQTLKPDVLTSFLQHNTTLRRLDLNVTLLSLPNSEQNVSMMTNTTLCRLYLNGTTPFLKDMVDRNLHNDRRKKTTLVGRLLGYNFGYPRQNSEMQDNSTID